MTYDDPQDPEIPEVQGHDVWSVELQQVAPGMLHTIFTRNGEPVGFVKIESEDEFIWLNNRVTGVRPKS